MSNRQLLADLRNALESLKESSQTSIQIDALSNYLRQWEQDANEATHTSEAHHARQLEKWKTELSVSSAHQLEMFKAVIEAGMTALKSAIVINGGAAATLLALWADALRLRASGTGSLGSLLTPLGSAWMCFMCGLGAAGTATGVRYLSQACYSHASFGDEGKRSLFQRLGNWLNNLAILLGCTSYVLFFVGAGYIYSAFRSS